MKVVPIFDKKKAMATGIMWIACLGFWGCASNDVYENRATDECSNLDFSIPRLYEGEIVKLYHNDKIILVFKADSLNGFRVQKKFCIHYEDNNVFKVKSFYKGKTFIDTSVVARKKDFGYILSSTYPLPKNWKSELAKDSTLLYRGLEPSPIENSVREVSISPDTIRKGMFRD